MLSFFASLYHFLHQYWLLPFLGWWAVCLMMVYVRRHDGWQNWLFGPLYLSLFAGMISFVGAVLSVDAANQRDPWTAGADNVHMQTVLGGLQNFFFEFYRADLNSTWLNVFTSLVAVVQFPIAILLGIMFFVSIMNTPEERMEGKA